MWDQEMVRPYLPLFDGHHYAFSITRNHNIITDISAHSDGNQ